MVGFLHLSCLVCSLAFTLLLLLYVPLVCFILDLLWIAVCFSLFDFGSLPFRWFCDWSLASPLPAIPYSSLDFARPRFPHCSHPRLVMPTQIRHIAPCRLVWILPGIGQDPDKTPWCDVSNLRGPDQTRVRTVGQTRPYEIERRVRDRLKRRCKRPITKSTKWEPKSSNVNHFGIKSRFNVEHSQEQQKYQYQRTETKTQMQRDNTWSESHWTYGTELRKIKGARNPNKACK